MYNFIASNKKLIYIVVLILTRSIQCVTAGTLPLATGEWPSFTSKDLKGKGVNTQFITAVVKEMGMEPEITFSEKLRLLFDRALIRVNQKGVEISLVSDME
ncbi:hypothetical protein [Spartinivicinus marinus]|uniref:hypothetical protein n=1 Tax=Spartinivicinus marinus TaxID=2994442 RepID=UPI00225A6FD6|nr:hypothetical protein [Spartinivicinus marinus]MCX4027783.1 hypothetical protein [Spartinivicinus marinus]